MQASNKKWYIGCSGYYYPEWKEVFYPKGLLKKDWLIFYAEHFNTLEVNNTFYRYPEAKLFKDWYARSPNGFNFSIKVPRLITHFKKFHELGTLLTDFYAMAKGELQEKLGCILFQLPPSARYSEELLERIVQHVKPGYKNIIEFRHISWWQEHVYHVFKEHQLAFCGSSFPRLPSYAVDTSAVLYYRFHGVPKLYASEYTNQELKQIIEQIELAKGKEAYIYFNNTVNAAAIRNARQTQELTLNK